jgi:hypothetical protein
MYIQADYNFMSSDIVDGIVRKSFEESHKWNFITSYLYEISDFSKFDNNIRFTVTGTVVISHTIFPFYFTVEV